MNLNNYINFFNLSNNYTIDDLKKSYNKLLLNYHKEKFNDKIYYDKINNYYSEFIDIINNNNNNNINNNNNNNINNNINNHNNNNNIVTYDNMKNYHNNIESNNIINKNYSFIEPLIIELFISYEESYNGSYKPLIILRIINNYNNISKEEETIYILIPEGIDNKESIIINNKGNCYNNNYGDVKIIINLKEHNNFIRNGLDIYYEKTITLKEILLGFNFELILLNKKKYIINNDNILVNMKKIIPNLGFKRDNFKGNLIINFKPIFPKFLTNEQKEILNNIL